MKVPYLSKKRRSDMALVVGEFSDAIATNLKPLAVDARLDSPWIRSMYPLLALLQVLSLKSGPLNPSREYALIGAQKTGDRDLFLRAIGAFNASDDVVAAMQGAYRETIFSGFIAELRSDLLMVLVQGLMYSYRGSAIGLRCAMEDLYRHLYYMDHPQEYSALFEGHSEHGMKIGPQFLRDYLRRTNYLAPLSRVTLDFSPRTDDCMDWFGMNEHLYAELSAAVHGASKWFAAVSSAASLKQVSVKDSKFDEVFVNFAKLCATFLIAAHRDLFCAAGDYDKSLVLEIFNKAERSHFRRLFNI